VQALYPEIIDHEYKYFLTLPFGEMIDAEHFKRVWKSWTHSLWNYKQKFDYIFIKEWQNDQFHLHGVVVADHPLPMELFAKQWRKFVKKHLGVHLRPQDVYIKPVESEMASLKYILNDLYDPKATQVIPSDLHRRLVIMSHKFSKIINDYKAKLINDSPYKRIKAHLRYPLETMAYISANTPTVPQTSFKTPWRASWCSEVTGDYDTKTPEPKSVPLTPSCSTGVKTMASKGETSSCGSGKSSAYNNTG